MPESLHQSVDPAIANDWFAIGHGDGLPAGQSVTRRLLGHDLTVSRSASGALHGHAASGEPVAVCEHCGFVLACLGAAPKPLFELPEFDAPGRRFIYMGDIGLHSGGLRVVENFLDMAHFPFVHAHILGSTASTEVRGYSVELDARQELWARGCKFVQPMASAASEGEADVGYTYRVINPFSPLLYKLSEGDDSSTDIIFLFVQPTEEDACIVHFAISLFDTTNSDSAITAFQQTILGQDKPILENHLYKRLPLDARLEVPSRADASSSAFRRWLRQIGLRWGVEPQSGLAPARLELVVADKRTVAQDVVSFTLRSPGEGPLPPFSPGDHLDVHLPGGLIRQYSLCNGPADEASYTLAVKREAHSRGGSVALHDAVQAGDRLSVSLPKSNFALQPGAHATLLIAGGIGITPLLSMARHLGATTGQANSANAPSVVLHYFSRSAEHAAWQPELGTALGDHWHLHAGQSPEATRATLDALIRKAPEGTHVYACGPGPLMQAVKVAALGAGWGPERLHFEYFKREASPDTAGAPFALTLGRSGRTVHVAGDQSIVEALRSIDVAVQTSCEQGVCGTCLCTEIDGEPDHRDQYLSEAEKAAGLQILPCVSRARGASLVLDL